MTIVPDPPSLPGTEELGRGEAASIAYASLATDPCLLLIDERLGREVATRLGFRISGTMAIIADAARMGKVGFEDVLQRLRRTRFRVSEAVIQEARRRSLPPRPSDPRQCE